MKKCSDVVEGLYREWFLKQLTLTWTKAIASDLDSLGYVSEINEQRRFYSHYVSPNVSKGNRVFVIISDALRYEVAAELAESLGHNTKGKATLDSTFVWAAAFFMRSDIARDLSRVFISLFISFVLISFNGSPPSIIIKETVLREAVLFLAFL